MPFNACRRRVAAFAAMSLLTLACPLAASAQWLAEPIPTGRQSDTAVAPILRSAIQGEEQTHPLGLILAGSAASALGCLGGVILGPPIAAAVADDLSAALVGACTIGSALATPFAVHVTNRRRGSLEASYGAAALIAGGTLVVASAVGPGSDQGFRVLLLSMGVHALSAMIVEQASAEGSVE